MKIILKTLSTVALAAVLVTNCESKKTEIKAVVAENKAVAKEIVQKNNPEKGKNVPNNMVCMVNDAYMGKEQIEVLFEGKMYYGCCNMCKEKIPKDESARYATDPHSLKKISKADAYIVVIGNNNEVAYFESEGNYQQFLKENS
jgi:YHS domain-containing protein